MAIRDKDGNVYTLRGPNPLLKDQSEWDRSKVKLINLGWKSEIVLDQRNPVKAESEGVFDIGEELGAVEEPVTKIIPARNFIKEINETTPIKPQELKPQLPATKNDVIEIEPSVVINVDPKVARIFKERGVEFYCAPVMGKKTHRDDFYGNSYDTPIYGEEFIFDAVIVDQSDLQLQFWCIKSIPKGSIVYRKDKEGGERWWQIQDFQERSGGWLLIASISDLNPQFN